MRTHVGSIWKLVVRRAAAPYASGEDRLAAMSYRESPCSFRYNSPANAVRDAFEGTVALR